MCECRTWRIVTLPRHGRQLCARQYEKPALKEGGLYSVDPVANAVDDGMQPAGDTGILRDPPSQGESRGVEEPPRVALIEFLEGGLIPFLHHLGDPLDVDHALPIEAENGVVGLLSVRSVPRYRSKVRAWCSVAGPEVRSARRRAPAGHAR